MGGISLLIVDKREIWREALASLLSDKPEIGKITTSPSASDAIKKAIAIRPDVILIIMEPEETNIAEVTRYVSESLPKSAILVLSHSAKEEDLISSIRAGARGYVSKSIVISDLIKTIMLIHQGNIIVSPPMATKIIQEFLVVERDRSVGTTNYENLTNREKEVLQLLAIGASNREISNALFIAENTVKVHIHSIMEKWHVNSRLKAIMIAHEKGISTKTDNIPRIIDRKKPALSDKVLDKKSDANSKEQ